MRHARSWRLALAALLVAGCSTGPPAAPTTTTPAASAPIVVNALDFERTLLPARTGDSYAARILSLLFRGLVRYDAKGKAVNEVAESIETLDERTLRVTLTPGWRFSNGEAVTATSFVDAWSAGAAPGDGQVHRWLFSPIAGFDAAARSTHTPGSAPPRLSGLTVVDDLTFTIRLSAPSPAFVERLGHHAFVPLPSIAHRDEDSFARAPVGNGPYVLEDGWQEGPHIRLRPSSAYIGRDPASNQGIDMRVYGDLPSARADLDAGRLDVLDDLPSDDLSDYRSDLGQRAVNQPVGRTVGIVVPVDAPGWGGAAGLPARQAVSMAVDREDIASTVFAGTRLPATDLAAPVVEGYSQSLCGALCSHDPQAAVDVLASARSVPGELTLAYNADAGHETWVREVCEDVTEALGIACSPRAYPTLPALHEAIATGRERGPFVRVHQMDYAALESFLAPRFVADAAGNDSGYADPRAQSLLMRAAVAPADERVADYVDAETVVLPDLPVIPLWAANATAAYGEAVTDVRTDVFGVPVYTQIRRD